MIELFTRVGRRLCKIDPNDHFMQFPGGELHMKSDADMFTGDEIALIRGYVETNDFIKLAMWSEVVRDQAGTSHAYIPYLPAARADKGVPLGGQIYADLIKIANVDYLVATDVHSQKAVDFYSGFGLIDHPVDSIVAKHLIVNGHRHDAIIAPDKGAAARARIFAEYMKLPVLQAEKVRDQDTGELSGFSCPDAEEFGEGHFLIFDDICDGGGTFNGLADQIMQKNQKATLDLFVTHGIFSKGGWELDRRFRNIFTTDTWSDYSTADGAVVIPVVQQVLKNI
ncbi:phosphoribosyl pyrophosphate transferase [Rhodococcus phage NiceHouse]|nr:phosphoribosyl pyrophosphate transferase [Rhodococcus phage NiceHouse]